MSRKNIRLSSSCAGWGGVVTWVLALSGCGGLLVDPERSRTLNVPPSRQSQGLDSRPAGGAAAGSSDAFDVSRVPASSLLSNTRDLHAQDRYHDVRPGETLSGIARQYGVTLARLLDANGLDVNAVIQPGQLIYIPE